HRRSFTDPKASSSVCACQYELVQGDRPRANEATQHGLLAHYAEKFDSFSRANVAGRQRCDSGLGDGEAFSTPAGSSETIGQLRRTAAADLRAQAAYIETATRASGERHGRILDAVDWTTHRECASGLDNDGQPWTTMVNESTRLELFFNLLIDGPCREHVEVVGILWASNGDA